MTAAILGAGQFRDSLPRALDRAPWQTQMRPHTKVDPIEREIEVALRPRAFIRRRRVFLVS